MLIVSALLATSCADDDGYEPDPSDTENVQINKGVHQYLTSQYLWNDEYSSLTPDYAQDYKDFLKTMLLRLTTNTLDKKADENGDFSLYSYIELHNGVSDDDASAVATTSKELEYSYGFTGLTAVSLTQSDSTSLIYFCVQGVYPQSGISEAGIKRGDMIRQVDGEPITSDNYVDLYKSLMQPSASQTTQLGVAEFANGKQTGMRNADAACKAIYCNPIIHQSMTDTCGHKIGYLVYDNFDAGFDEELLEEFAEMHQAGISDLVLDLRYNRGGRTTSANLLASLIAGEACHDKVFASMRYNDSRMAKRKNKLDNTNFAFPKYSGLNTDISATSLGLQTVYVLTGGNTASASELVINALRGIGISVVLIGTTTEGKNVGMEPYTLTTTFGNTYRLVPITFQTYNAQGFGDYENGFTPTIELNETNPYNQEGVFYVYRDYGTAGEPLFAKALETITGSSVKANRLAGHTTMTGTPLPLPQLTHPGHEGIIK